MYLASKEGNLDFMKFLLTQKGIRADFRDSTGIPIVFDLNSTPLHAAARFNHIEICQLLLSIENVDVNYQDEILYYYFK